MQTTTSKLSLLIMSIIMSAACAKKADPLTYEKANPKKEAAASDTTDSKGKDKNPKPEAPRTDPPAEPAEIVTEEPAKPAPTETKPAPTVTVPAPVVLGAPAPKANSNNSGATVNQPATPQSTSTKSDIDDGSRCPKDDNDPAIPNSDKKCSKLIVEDPKAIEACLLLKVVEYSTQLKTENREINTGSLNWVMYRSKEDCHGNNLTDQEILKRIHLKLQEVGLKLFEDAADVINTYVAGFLPQSVPAKPKEKILRSTEYHFAKVLQYGSRDFRQPKDAVNYSIGKVQKTIHLTETNDDGSQGPSKEASDKTIDIFSNISAYSFGSELNSRKMYTLEYKDETGSLTLDYNFYEGSLSGLKNGESAKVVLTKASWLKVIEFETQKLLTKYYAGIPRSSLRILLSPLDPPTARTCSIGKGYFLGYRAIACMDPEFRVRIQLLETGLDTVAGTDAQ